MIELTTGILSYSIREDGVNARFAVCGSALPMKEGPCARLTDGAGNVSLGNYAPLEESHRIAEMIRKEDIPAVVINMESATYDQGLAQELANQLDAPCLAITDLKAEHLYMAVRQASDELKRVDN